MDIRKLNCSFALASYFSGIAPEAVAGIYIKHVNLQLPYPQITLDIRAILLQT